jgi:dipeptidyl aminopeptidase/acylaminoacyl peptidase
MYGVASVMLYFCASWSVLGQTAAAPVPVPVESFFSNNAFGGAALSPSGRYLAVRTNAKKGRDFLVVVDLDTRAGTGVAGYPDADIGNFQWVNDNRLVFDLRDANVTSADQDYAPGLYAVNRDGSELIQLAARDGDRRGAPQPWNTFLMAQHGSQDSEWIYVVRPTYDDWFKYAGTVLLRLNTVTGATQVAPRPGQQVSNFMLDFKGEPRLAMSYNDLRNTMYYREPATGQWRVLSSSAAFGHASDAIEPLGFGPDGTLFVVANGGANMAAMRTFDFESGKPSKEALVDIPEYDFAGSLVSGAQVLGVRVTTDAEINVWFDPAMKEIQKAVDKVFPATMNLITVPRRRGSPWVLVESYSDVQPSRFALYHTVSGLVSVVGATYPDIPSERMGRQETVRFKARDGLEIPGLLTVPPGGVRKNLPMVVLVHGGPWVRGASWRWHPESQFLASRGYAVLEVEFRGSTGFGHAHFEAGLKQWGLAMQNDIADGTRWAIAQGIADPKRICIAGSSYGGYAALMGLVNDPDLYRCGVEWSGVTDIELMYTGTWFSKSDASSGYLRYGMPLMVGDRAKDAAQLKATSPIQQAARIHQPLLLAYGREDKRVPIYHGKKFYAAVTRTNKQVEWIDYSGEGHGWSLPKNRIDFWQHVEKFLGKNIGAAAQPQ